MKKKKRNVIVLAIGIFLVMGGLLVFSGNTRDGIADGYSLPKQGLYDDCDLSSPDCLTHLDHMGKYGAGFELVLNYGSGSSNKTAAQYQAYLDCAQKNGIQVIWDFNDLFNRTDGPETAAAVVREVKDHPATWGYYIGDENTAEQAAAVANLTVAIKAADPDHPCLFVGMQTTDNLDAFSGAADYLGLDIYPIGDGRESSAMVSEVGNTATALREYNALRSKKTVLVLQAFNWANDSAAPDWPDCRWPTRDEMRQMRDMAIQEGNPDIILWFAYYHAGAAGEEDHWNDLVWAAYGDK